MYSLGTVNSKINGTQKVFKCPLYNTGTVNSKINGTPNVFTSPFQSYIIF